jgi:hypothetical protein
MTASRGILSPASGEPVTLEPNPRPADEPILVFVHVRKTAGTTLRRIIRRQYPRGTVWESDNDTPPRLSPEMFAGMRVLQGHFPFGIHARLPRPVTYITLLRDPVERALSVYYFMRRRPLHALHPLSLRLPVDEFFDAAGPDAANEQTRYLSGHLDPGPASVETALHNLRDRFAAFGLDERFDESLLLFRRRLGWRSVRYRRENMTRSRPHRDDLPASTIRSLERIHALDIELYAPAADLFDATVRSLGPDFQRELRAFRRRNGVYAAVADRVHRAYEALLPEPVRALARRARNGIRPIHLLSAGAALPGESPTGEGHGRLPDRPL